MTPIHLLPNELVFEFCRKIQVVQTPDTVLLASVNIHTYLAERYRKKLVYRDAIAFIMAKLNNGSGVAIDIGRNRHQDEEGSAKSQQWQSESGNVFELLTNHLRFQFQANGTKERNNLCSISEDAFESADVQYLFRLIAPLIKPITLNLVNFCVATGLLRFLHSLSSPIDCIMIDAKHFLLEPICTALNKCCNKPTINVNMDLSGEQKQQLRRAFIHWLNANNGGHAKQFEFYYLECHEIYLLLDEIKTDFHRATSKRPMSIHFYHPYGEPEEIGEFNVRNSAAGEELQLELVIITQSHYQLSNSVIFINIEIRV